jgi:hypothetical protein
MPQRIDMEQRTYGNIFAKFGVDISNAAYVQEIDGQIVGAWSTEEMMVDITSPSDELNKYGYGTSCLENSLEVTTLLMYALHYNKAHFMTNYPEAFLMLHGDVDPVGLESFKSQIYAEVGPQGNQRLPVFATGDVVNKAELLRLRDSLHEMDFPILIRMFAALKCSAYRAHPSLINFAPDSGGSRPVINNETQETQIALAQEEGFHAILDNLSGWLTRALIEPWYEDLELVWTVQDQPTEQEQIEIWERKVSLGYTIDEMRSALGDVPLDDATNGMVLGNYANNAYFFQAQQRQMEIMQQAQQAQGQGEQSPYEQTAYPEAPGRRGPQDWTGGEEQDFTEEAGPTEM